MNPLYRDVAHLHAGGIREGFLSTLGVPFLALMYEAVDGAEGSMLLVSRKDGRVVGFVAGALAIGPVYRKLLGKWPYLVVALLPVLLRPRAILHILETLRYARRSVTAQTGPQAELLSISLDPAYRGQGRAEGLYRGLEAYFRSKGVLRFRIVAGASLVPARRFYERMGAVESTRIKVHDGQESIVYIQEVN